MFVKPFVKCQGYRGDVTVSWRASCHLIETFQTYIETEKS